MLMKCLVFFGVGFVLGAVAARLYWNKAIGYAHAKETEFRAWVGNEFRKL